MHTAHKDRDNPVLEFISRLLDLRSTGIVYSIYGGSDTPTQLQHFRYVRQLVRFPCTYTHGRQRNTYVEGIRARPFWVQRKELYSSYNIYLVTSLYDLEYTKILTAMRYA